jgi:hypothetical protein
VSRLKARKNLRDLHLATVERVAVSKLMMVDKWNIDFNTESESWCNFDSVRGDKKSALGFACLEPHIFCTEGNLQVSRDFVILLTSETPTSTDKVTR